MTASTSKSRRVGRTLIARLTSVAALGLTAALLVPQTAQAHGTIWTSSEWRKTSDCPCYIDDEVDGTYFKHDPGAEAAKMRVYQGDRLVGKVEFHPQGEWLWVYDTYANSDAIYWHVSWPGGDRWIKGPSGGKHDAVNLSIDDGDKVTISAWDSRGYEDNGTVHYYDFMRSIKAIA